MAATLPNAEITDSSDFLKQFRVHLCLVSNQAAPNFLPIVFCKPARVVLFVSAEMQDTGKHLQEALHRAVPQTKIEIVEIADAWDLEACSTLFFEKIVSLDGERALFNVTGGTKIMSFAALTTAFDTDVPAIYLNEKNNTIHLLSTPHKEEQQRMPSIVVKTSLRNYLAAYGYAVRESASAPTLSLDVAETLDYLLRQPSMREVVSKLNRIAVDAEEKSFNKKTRQQEKGTPKPIHMEDVRKALSDKNREAFDVLCTYFEKMGRLRVQGSQCVFPTEADRFFVAGGWLENYVVSKLAQLGLKPEGNIVVERGARNEIDAAFMYDECLYIVECKTCFYPTADDANKVLYKLESLAKLGGLKTKLVLVSYQPLPDASRKRAKDQGITVFCAEQLKDLVGCFKGLISGKL